MQRTPSTHHAAMLEHWSDELYMAPRETVNRLRYCFPDLPEPVLERMAVLHPDTAHTARYCRRRMAYHRRMLRRR